MARGPSSWTTTWRGTAVLAVLLALAAAGLLWRAPWRTEAPAAVREDGQPASELAHLKMLGLALRLHADEHDGRYPASVADIEWRQGKPGLEADGLPAVASRFHTDNGRALDWLYYPGHTTGDPADTILAASPVPLGPDKGHRLVLRLSNAAEVMPEGEFQRQVGQAP